MYSAALHYLPFLIVQLAGGPLHSPVLQTSVGHCPQPRGCGRETCRRVPRVLIPHACSHMSLPLAMSARCFDLHLQEKPPQAVVVAPPSIRGLGCLGPAPVFSSHSVAVRSPACFPHPTPVAVAFAASGNPWRPPGSGPHGSLGGEAREVLLGPASSALLGPSSLSTPAFRPNKLLDIAQTLARNDLVGAPL